MPPLHLCLPAVGLRKGRPQGVPPLPLYHPAVGLGWLIRPLGLPPLPIYHPAVGLRNGWQIHRQGELEGNWLKTWSGVA